jgi:hypothetical protein
MVPVAPWRVGRSLPELLGGAAELGYPVVLKVDSEARRTVGEAGGAAIDLHDDAQLEAAYNRMLAARGEAMLPAVVQAMVDAAAMVRVELIQDPDLGSFVRVGLGGAAGANLAPLAQRFLPLTDADVSFLVDVLAAALTVRAASVEPVGGLIARLGLLGAAIPELSLLCLDPILISSDGAVTVDVVITLRPLADDPLAGVRRL